MPIPLVVIYITFISLGLPDSLFGVSWPVVHVEFGTAQSFATVYSIITGICTGGVSFIQLAFDYIATATTFTITQYVLLALCAGIFLANAHTVTILKKANN